MKTWKTLPLGWFQRDRRSLVTICGHVAAARAQAGFSDLSFEVKRTIASDLQAQRFCENYMTCLVDPMGDVFTK